MLEGFFDGLEVIMDHECGCEAGTGSDHRVSGLEGEIQCAFEADGEPFRGVTSLEGRRSTEAEGRFQTTKLGSLGSELGWTGLDWDRAGESTAGRMNLVWWGSLSNSRRRVIFQIETSLASGLLASLCSERHTDGRAGRWLTGLCLG